jgi:hypothetical protein
MVEKSAVLQMMMMMTYLFISRYFNRKWTSSIEKFASEVS